VTRRLLEGSAAIAEAMVTAGCRFFAGYPMTPFTEVLEHLARLLPEAGGTCVNAESEIEAVGMAWGAAAAGLRSATGSVGQGLSLMQESLAELCHARLPLVVLDMARGQGDYFQATRGGGHGDYRHVVLAPASVAEAVELVAWAFDLADRFRNPVLVMGDYYLAHLEEALDPAALVDHAQHEVLARFGPLPAKDWALDGSTGGTGRARILSPIHASRVDEPGFADYGTRLGTIVDHVARITEQLPPMAETTTTEEASVVVVAFGTAARYARAAVTRLRTEGRLVGLVRPVTLWPFPASEVARAAQGARAVAVFELNAGQMIDDVRLAVADRVPVVPIGGVAFDEAGFGISPLYDVNVVAERIAGVLEASR
jgi:2-oxoglutarate ferredoxin oxidoreductase subunit alpha